jgi:small subunit ribosomal protein S16
MFFVQDSSPAKTAPAEILQGYHIIERKQAMSVKIRLARGGAKKKPYYQIVVADERCPRDGRYIENLGQYNPRAEKDQVNLDEARALSWLNKGAQPSEAVVNILRREGVWSTFKGEKQA